MITGQITTSAYDVQKCGVQNCDQKTEGKAPFERFRSRWEWNISVTIALKELTLEGVY